MSVIHGVAYWPKVFPHNVAEKYEPADGYEYTINVGNLDEENKAIIKKDKLMNLKIKTSEKNPEQDEFVIVKKSQFWPDGKEDTPPLVYTAKMNPMNGDVLIGNGSKVKVYYDTYVNKNGKYGKLMGVQVLDLVEYSGKEPSLPATSVFEVEDGYIGDVSDDIPFASV